jgi:hypothetical protein
MQEAGYRPRDGVWFVHAAFEQPTDARRFLGEQRLTFSCVRFYLIGPETPFLL